MVGNLKPYFSDPAKQNSNYYLQEVKSLVLNFGKRNNKENNNKKTKKKCSDRTLPDTADDL
jgi:hypothetical protein